MTRALREASAAVGLWLQFLILQVMTMSRLATSVGPDVDSWTGDFGLARLPGVAATGMVTFTCFGYASQSAVIPVGATVRTSNGNLTFAVTEDTTNPAWSAASDGYVRPAGTVSITVPVQASVVGSTGNVQAATVNLLGQSISGVDTVTNALPFSSGVDAEADSALKARFVPYINSRARATLGAIGSSIAGVQQGLTYAIEENVDPRGAPRPGYFVVIVDDGSGSPPPSLISAVSAAVDAVRPVGTGFAVLPPQVLSVTISLSLSLASGADPAAVRQNVLSAITTFVDALPVGALLPFSRLSGLAYDADPAVLNVRNVAVDGASNDVGGGVGQVVRVLLVTVS